MNPLISTIISLKKEKQNYYEQLWRKKYMDIDLDTGGVELPQVRIYEKSFYNNYLVTQVDFSFLNNTYQVYSGGAPYFNPGVNILTGSALSICLKIIALQEASDWREILTATNTS